MLSKELLTKDFRRFFGNVDSCKT